MPIALVIIGIVLAVTAFRGTYGDLGNLVIGDLTGGKDSFLVWLAAIVIVGMAGYIPKAETPARAFLALIILAMLLSNSGVFAKFVSAVQSAQAQPAPANQEPPFKGALPISISGAGGGSSALGQASQAAGIAKTIGGFFGL
jgi:hypothetical protein